MQASKRAHQAQLSKLLGSSLALCGVEAKNRSLGRCDHKNLIMNHKSREWKLRLKAAALTRIELTRANHRNRRKIAGNRRKPDTSLQTEDNVPSCPSWLSFICFLLLEEKEGAGFKA